MAPPRLGRVLTGVGKAKRSPSPGTGRAVLRHMAAAACRAKSLAAPCAAFEFHGRFRVLWLVRPDFIFMSFYPTGDLPNETICDTYV